MRLSTERDRDGSRAIAVLHSAFDAGVTFLDTADAYCWDASEVGHNERLIAEALATWPGDRERIIVASKGGLTRPQGNWIADGRARHLVAACEASRRALGVERIALYQLHAPDPRTPLATSVRALDSLKRDGRIEAIGLCNVTVQQIEEARCITEIAAVQVELSFWRETGILSGVAEYCLTNGIRLLANRPLGGTRSQHRTLRDPLLADLALRHGVTPFEIALAWLTHLSEHIVPLPGATRVETAQSIARVHQIVLIDQDLARLGERVPAGGRLRRRARGDRGGRGENTQGDRGDQGGNTQGDQGDQGENKLPDLPDLPVLNKTILPDLPVLHDREVALIMGLPGAGKSTLAQSFVAQGYARLNRDLSGGSLSDLTPSLDRLIASGSSRIVLDNTYVSRASRAPVIETARKHGLPVRCIRLGTSLEDAQVNAVGRMVSRYDRLLGPEEIRKAARRDIGMFAPSAQFRCQRQLEEPHASEGFSQVEVRPFDRRRDPSFTNRAVIVWCDGVLISSRSGRRTASSLDDMEVIAERSPLLRRYQADGWRLLGLSWQPDIAEAGVSAEQVEACFAQMRERIRLEIEVAYCPHGGGPPVCWCRKPLPGLAVVFIHRHRLDARRCIYVGSGSQDPGFARRLGFEYRDAADFFGPQTGEVGEVKEIKEIKEK